MNLALEFFEDFLSQELHHRKTNTGALTLSRPLSSFESKVAAIDVGLQQFKKGFRTQMLNCQTEEKVRLMIRFYQSAILQLSQRASAFIPPYYAANIDEPPAEALPVTLAIKLCAAFEQMLHYVNAYAPGQFNMDFMVPHVMVMRTVRERRAELQMLLLVAEEYKVDESLMAVALQPIRKFIAHPASDTITFRELFYVRTLAEKLLTVMDRSLPEERDEAIVSALIHLNFNSNEFFGYMQEKIRIAMSDAGEMSEQLECLFHHLKHIRQIVVRPDFFLCAQPTITEQLSQWIKEEINYLEGSYPGITRAVRAVLPVATSKVATNFTVPGMGLFCKLLEEGKLFQGKVEVKNLMRIITMNFSSQCQSSMSVNNLCNSFYTITPATARSMERILLHLLMLVRKWL